MTLRDTALEYFDRLGWVCLPAKGKGTLVDWAGKPKPIRDELDELWRSRPRATSMWMHTGWSRMVVLDIDTDEARSYWAIDRRLSISPFYDQTPRGGMHIYYRMPEGWDPHDVPHGDGDGPESKWTLRAGVGGVIVPPSEGYTWPRRSPLDPGVPEIPLWTHGDIRRARSGQSRAAGPVGDREPLAELLAQLPATGPGHRNNLLTQIGGHFVNALVGQPDAWLETMRVFNSALAEPLDEAEFYNTVAKMYDNYSARAEAKAEAAAERRENPKNDYTLRLEPDRIVATWYDSKGEDQGERPWVDWGFEITGRGRDEKDRALYRLTVNRHGRSAVDQYINTSELSDRRRFNAWLIDRQLGCRLDPAPSQFDKHALERLAGLIQDASLSVPEIRSVSFLGYSKEDGGTLTTEGLITPNGLQPLSVRVPASLADRISFGFGPDPLPVLREVMTFQYEDPAAVFASWLMACAVKPLIPASLFPFMAIEGGSGTGKTNGFFGMIQQLVGLRKHADATGAAFRNMLGSTSSVPVWLDDVKDVRGFQELVRQAAGEGAVTKMGGANWQDENRYELRAPIVLSGESLSMVTSERALNDRAVMLELTERVQDRKSLRNPKVRQWEDVRELEQKYPSLTVFAGSLNQLILQAAIPTLDEWSTFAQQGDEIVPGRPGEVATTLIFGAAVLDRLLDTGELYSARVLAWCRQRWADYNSAEDSLTMELLPRLIARLQSRGEFMSDPEAGKMCGVFRDGRHLYIHAEQASLRLSDEFRFGDKRYNDFVGRGAVLRQLQTLKRNGQATSVTRRVGRNPDTRFWQLSEELSRTVMERVGEVVKDSDLSSKRTLL